jgi:hypothetical protein
MEACCYACAGGVITARSADYASPLRAGKTGSALVDTRYGLGGSFRCPGRRTKRPLLRQGPLDVCGKLSAIAEKRADLVPQIAIAARLVRLRIFAGEALNAADELGLLNGELEIAQPLTVRPAQLRRIVGRQPQHLVQLVGVYRGRPLRLIHRNQAYRISARGGVP